MAKRPEHFPWDIPDSCFDAPEFWVAGLAECERFLRALPEVEVSEIGRSAGGRPLLAATLGEREPIARTSTSLSSSMGGVGLAGWDPDKWRPASFYGPERGKPVLVIQGNLHGSEIACTVAAMNLLNLAVRGTDLRGRENEPLRRAVRALRLVVIPHANPDGRARWEPARQLEDCTKEQAQRVTQGRLADGTPLAWPSCKSLFPLPPGGLLGAYYNDAGVNLNHDRFLDADRAPETDALLRFYLEEMPDAAVLAHTDMGTLLGGPPPFVPEEIQGVHHRIAGAVAAEVRRRGLPVFSYPHFARAGGMSRAFTQPDAVYHQCGATPLLVEFAQSTDGHRLSFDTILDVGMAVLETIILYGLEIGFRPALRKHLADGRTVTAYGPL